MKMRGALLALLALLALGGASSSLTTHARSSSSSSSGGSSSGSGGHASSNTGHGSSHGAHSFHSRSHDKPPDAARSGDAGGSTITPPKYSRRRRIRKSQPKQAMGALFEALKESVEDGTSERTPQLLKKVEQLMQFCEYDFDEVEDEIDLEKDVTDQLAEVLGLQPAGEDDSRPNAGQGAGISGGRASDAGADRASGADAAGGSSDGASGGASSGSGNSGSAGSDGNAGADGSGNAAAGGAAGGDDVPAPGSTRKRRRSYKSQSADKQEIVRLKRVVKKLKDHQAAEVTKLMAVKKRVESLVSSLSGTRRNLLEAKKESLDMGNELERIHKQAAAAAQLEKEISEIQEHARINYETGQVELSLETGETSSLSLDEVAAKVQQATFEKNKGRHLYHSDESRHGHHDKADDILSNLADPAVLHADLRLLLDIVLLLGSATIGGMIAAVAYMPPIIGYIAGGVIVGPSGLELVQTVVQVDTLAQFGSVFFLFAHGLEYSFSEQRQFQTVAVGGCVLSTAICAVCIQIYALASGIVQSPLEGGLLGLSSSLSSLSLVLDYLHEQRLLHTVHGKVMVGFLTFQGLMMGLLFSIPPAISGGVVSVGGVGLALLRSFSGIVLVAAFAYAFSRYAMPTLLEFLTKNRANYDELYLLGVVSLAMVMALLTEFLGLSLDLGAFFAGLMLAGSPFMKRTSAAIQPLASVFAAMLFASIGMIINPMFFWTNLGVIIIVVVQIVVIKVIIVTTVVRLFSYSWKISIISGIGLAHVGEFSLLFSSKLHAHLLLSRRAYLVFLAATVTTIVLAPLVLRMMHYLIPRIMRVLNIPNVETEDDYKAHYQLRPVRSVTTRPFD